MINRSQASGKVGELPCPVCSAPSVRLWPAPGWGEWRECQGCTLRFVNPLSLQDTPSDLYESAYRGDRDDAGMREFAERVAKRKALIGKPDLWFWTPAFSEILEWVPRVAGPGATILEVGCGPGFFLHAARRAGFGAYGIDAAETAVRLNEADGFPCWHGTVEDVPSDWVRPDVVVAMFVLHHLPAPGDFFRTLRQKFPSAYVAIAQYGPSNIDAVKSEPPRTLTRWSATALATALALSGYDPDVRSLRGSGAEARPLRPLRRVAAKAIGVPGLYRLGKALETRVVRALLGPVIGQRDFVLLGFGTPASSGGALGFNYRGVGRAPA